MALNGVGNDAAMIVCISAVQQIEARTNARDSCRNVGSGRTTWGPVRHIYI
jgi:hypothetical protein